MNRGRDKFNKIAPAIMLLVRVISLLPTKVLKWLLSFFQQTKGNKGLLIRYILFRSISPKCGDNVSIHPNVYLFYPEKLSLGKNVSIHPFCYIDAVGDINIGDDVSIAHGTSILSSTHEYVRKDLLIKDQGMVMAKTVISSNVWVGAKATILCGVTISSGSIIGSGAVVTKGVSEDSVVGGVPAKWIKQRIK